MKTLPIRHIAMCLVDDQNQGVGPVGRKCRLKQMLLVGYVTVGTTTSELLRKQLRLTGNSVGEHSSYTNIE